MSALNYLASNSFPIEGHELKLLKILTYPHPILSKTAGPVEIFDEKLKELCRNMLHTMYNAPGIGLAAPQIGIDKRIFVIDVDYERKKVTSSEGKVIYHLSNFNPYIFINPVLKMGEEFINYQEGCLSLPGIYEEIQRSQKITVEYCDEFGNKKVLIAEDLFSICIQHENDHLNGIVFLDKLGQLKKNLLKKKLLKQKKLKNQT